MLTFHEGDVFTTTLPAVAHGVNTEGLMGAGIAKIIRAKFPEVYHIYRHYCDAGMILPGENLATSTAGSDIKWVLNIASQDLPGPHARIEWLESGLEDAAIFCETEGLAGFAAPRIGAGIGGLEWEDVKTTFQKIAITHPHVEIEIWTL